MMSTTESRCSARAVPQNTVVSFQCNSAMDRCSTCWLCSLTEAYRTLAPVDLKLDLVQTLSASKAGAHCLQWSSTLLTGLVAQVLTKTGFLSKLSCPRRTDCSGSKLLLSVQPLPGCSTFVHSLPSRLPTLTLTADAFVFVLTKTRTKQCLLACAYGAAVLFQSNIARAVLETKAVAFTPARI